MRVTRTLIVPFVLLAALFAFVQPASSVAVSPTIASITRDGCKVYTDVSSPGAGTVWFSVWDDGVVLDSQSYVFDGPGNHTFVWTIKTDINAGAPGVLIGIGSTENGYDYDYDGNWDFEGSDDIAKACAAAATDRPHTPIEDPSTVPSTVPDTTVPVTTVPETTIPVDTIPDTTPPTDTSPSTPAAPGGTSNGSGVAPAAAAQPVTSSPTYTG